MRGPSRLPEAHEAADPVVAHREVDHGVLRAAAHERAPRRRREVVGDHPRQRHRGQDEATQGEVDESAPPRLLRAQPVDRREGRQDHKRGQHLHVEADSNQRHREEEEVAPPALGRPQERPGREQQHQHEAGVGVPGAVHRDRDRGHGQEEPGQQPGGGAPVTPDQMREQRHRGHPLDHLRQEHRERVEAEDLDARHLDPQRERRLVDRDEAGRIEGVVEERVPARHHAPHAGRVVLVVEPVLVETPEAQRRREGQDRDLSEHYRGRPSRRRGSVQVGGRHDRRARIHGVAPGPRARSAARSPRPRAASPRRPPRWRWRRARRWCRPRPCPCSRRG